MKFSRQHEAVLAVVTAALLAGSAGVSAAGSKGDIGYIGFALNTSFLSTFSDEIRDAITAAG